MRLFIILADSSVEDNFRQRGSVTLSLFNLKQWRETSLKKRGFNSIQTPSSNEIAEIKCEDK